MPDWNRQRERLYRRFLHPAFRPALQYTEFRTDFTPGRRAESHPTARQRGGFLRRHRDKRIRDKRQQLPHTSRLFRKPQRLSVKRDERPAHASRFLRLRKQRGIRLP